MILSYESFKAENELNIVSSFLSELSNFILILSFISSFRFSFLTLILINFGFNFDFLNLFGEIFNFFN